MIATASYDGSVRLWNSVSGLQIGTPLRHQGAEPILGVAFNPNGALLATSSREVEPPSFGRSKTGPNNYSHCNTRTDNDIQFDQWPAPGDTSFDNSVRLWNAQNRRGSFRSHSGIASRPREAAFSPDGLVLATASHDGR